MGFERLGRVWLSTGWDRAVHSRLGSLHFGDRMEPLRDSEQAGACVRPPVPGWVEARQRVGRA